MLFRLFTSLLVFVLSFSVVAQNLVPNHDFSLTNSNVHGPIAIQGSMIDWTYPSAPDGQLGYYGTAHDTMCFNPQSLVIGGCPGLSVSNSTYRYSTPLPYEGKGMILGNFYYDSITNYIFVQGGLGYIHSIVQHYLRY